ncbi:MAG: hypothetical protein EG823_00350 [Actinobacteria bacterium]|nr:hypothetical protein [Actinomycetota bacterium]
MSDGMQQYPQQQVPAPDPGRDVAKSRSGLLFALLGIVVVIGAIVGVLYLTGSGPFAKPEAEPAAQTETPAASTETTEATQAASTSTVTLPPADAQEVMYWEQFASNGTITELVENKFGSFELNQIATTGDKADIRVKGTYRDGTTLSGWMLLRQYDEAWYFTMITRDGNPTTTPVSGTPDAAVTKAIVERQAANQEVLKAILDGGYKVIAIDDVTTGAGTATVEVTLAGGSDGEAKGKITCISKEIGGVTHWFITGFSKT